MNFGQVNGLNTIGVKNCSINPSRKMGKLGGYFAYEFCKILGQNEQWDDRLNCTFPNKKDYDYETFDDRKFYKVLKYEINNLGEF